MSGYKRATVTLTRDEYDRLRESAEKLRTLPEVETHLTETINQQSIDALRKNLETIENRQVVFRHLITDFNGQIRAYEERNTQRFTDFQAVISARAQEVAGSLWDNVTDLIADQEKRVEAQLTQSRQETAEVIGVLQNEIARIAGNEQYKEKIASDWLAAAEAVYDYLEENYFCDVFLPGRLDGIRRSVDQARVNLDDGLIESAVLSLQQDYFRLSDTHQEIEKIQSEWQMLLLANWETLNQILAVAEASAYVQAVDLNGEPLPYEINVTYWSDGRLSQLIEDIHALLDALSSGEVIPLETLHVWREREIPALYQCLEDVVLDARIQAINSQLRINIADLVVCALSEQGFHLQAASYRASDERQAYMARMTALDGGEVIVKVEPKGAELGENELQLRSLDQKMRTEHELHQRWREISRSLSNFGLDVGAYVYDDSPETITAPGKSRMRTRSSGIRNGQGQKVGIKPHGR